MALTPSELRRRKMNLLMAMSYAAFASTKASTWSPTLLFAAGEQGAWYDPSDLTTMFTDAAGTTPVTAVEQPVGLLLDKSKGLALGAELVTNGDGTNTTGWDVGAGLSALISESGEFKATANGGVNSTFSRLVTLVAGKSYLVSVVVRSPSTNSVTNLGRLRVEGGLLSNLASQVSTEDQNVTLSGIVLATGTSTRIYVGVQTLSVWGGSGDILYVDNISVRELPGNHASQSTAASRPVLSARVNQLTYSEQFDNAAWVNYQTSDAGNTTTAPDGTTTADTLIATAGTNARFIYQLAPAVVSGAGYTVSFSAKAGTQGAVQFCSSDGFGVVGYVNFNLSTGAIGTSSIYTGSISSQGNGWYRCTVTLTATSAAAPNIVICMVADASATRAASWTAAGTETIFLWGADFRPANVGVNLPAYQRVGAAVTATTNPAVTGVPDYDTSGFPLYLKFDGVDDSLVTGSINFSTTDKMSVFAGLRKLSDAAAGYVLTSGLPFGGDAGSFAVAAAREVNIEYGAAARGTVLLNAQVDSSVYAAPYTNVYTTLFDIAGDSIIGRSNGVQFFTGSGDLGTGTFGAYVLSVGQYSAAAGLRFNGNLYSLIVRGALSTDAQIASTETYVNSKTGAY